MYLNVFLEVCVYTDLYVKMSKYLYLHIFVNIHIHQSISSC
jgi:hypothetical protein